MTLYPYTVWAHRSCQVIFPTAWEHLVGGWHSRHWAQPFGWGIGHNQYWYWYWYIVTLVHWRLQLAMILQSRWNDVSARWQSWQCMYRTCIYMTVIRMWPSIAQPQATEYDSQKYTHSYICTTHVTQELSCKSGCCTLVQHTMCSAGRADGMNRWKHSCHLVACSSPITVAMEEISPHFE